MAAETTSGRWEGAIPASAVYITLDDDSVVPLDTMLETYDALPIPDATAQELSDGTEEDVRHTSPKLLSDAFSNPALATAQELSDGTEEAARSVSPKLLADEFAAPATASALELQTGTEEGLRMFSPKLIFDEIARQIAAIS